MSLPSRLHLASISLPCRLILAEGVPLGERITFAGHEGEPEAQLNPKKKVWEKLMPSLNTSAERVGRYDEVPFMTSKGPCTVASIAGGGIG